MSSHRVHKVFAKAAVVAATGFTLFLLPLFSQAQLRSKSGDIVVMEPRSLPEAAQLGGNSFFLHADNAGRTYLYVEQAQGARLTVFDVTDPGHIRTVSSSALTVSGPFDFVRPLGNDAELIRFRDETTVAVLDLTKAKQPTLHLVPALADAGHSTPLGETGFLTLGEPYRYVRAVGRDYQVVDIATPTDPSVLTTVKLVKHRVVSDDMGTTFLLGSEGLTVVRRMNVESDYNTRQKQQSGN